MTVAAPEVAATPQLQRIGVVGAGAWGTALAQMLTLAGCNVTIWARKPEVVDEINRHHSNAALLPDVRLEPGVRATVDLGEALAAETVLLVVPAQHARTVAELAAAATQGSRNVVICAKGLEQSTSKFMCDVIAEAWPAAVPAVLSGPSFAIDVARGLPTAVTLASPDPQLGRHLAETLGYRNFRIYWTADMVGTELGGAVKNVLAIAAGIVDGRGLGASAHAALVTRGFAELTRLGAACGARAETLGGLSGLGDLLLTCSSPQSRNMSLGRALGQGQPLHDILGRRRAVTEGVATAAAVVRMAQRLDVEMPIAEAVAAIVDGRIGVEEAIDGLLRRPFRAEG